VASRAVRGGAWRRHGGNRYRGRTRAHEHRALGERRAGGGPSPAPCGQSPGVPRARRAGPGAGWGSRFAALSGALLAGLGRSGGRRVGVMAGAGIRAPLGRCWAGAVPGCGGAAGGPGGRDPHGIASSPPPGPAGLQRWLSSAGPAPRLCVVGSGPAGFYTAQHLLKVPGPGRGGRTHGGLPAEGGISALLRAPGDRGALLGAPGPVSGCRGGCLGQGP